MGSANTMIPEYLAMVDLVMKCTFSPMPMKWTYPWFDLGAIPWGLGITLGLNKGHLLFRLS